MIKSVPTAFIKAHEIIWKHGYWKFLCIPIIISAVLATILLTGCYFLSSLFGDLLDGYLSKLVALPKWVMGILSVFIFLTLLAPCYVIFRSLVMICYGPFIDRISKKAEIVVNGSVVEHETNFLDSIKRPAIMTVFSTMGLISVVIVSFLLGLIPIAGILLSLGFTIPANLFLSSISYLDPYLERNGNTPTQALKLMWRKRVTLIAFGMISFIITAIPILGWFIGPTYSVVAGVILSILIYSKETETHQT